MADIIIEYESRGASKSISDLQRLQAGLASTADGTTKLARSLSTSFKSAQDFAKNLGLTTQRAAAATQRIQELNRSNTNSAQRYKVLNKELGISRQQFLALDKAVSTQAQRLKELERQQRIATEGYQNLAIASGAVATAIGAVFTQGTRSFIEFSGALRQVGAISQSTGTEAFEELSDEIERLGIVTSKTPAEIAKTSVSLARAGFSAEEVKDALEGVVRASEATGESLETVGDIIAKTLRTFSLAASESDRVADALVATANNTNTTVSSLGESLAFVGAQAASSNQPLEDTLIAIGLLGDAGIQGSSAGTQLGQALERLKAASAGATSDLSGLVRGNNKAVEAFKLLNIEARDSEGQLRSLVDIVPEIQSQLEGLSQQDQDLIFRSLFGTQGGRALASLLQATPQRVAEVTQSIRESERAAADASEELLKGLGGALNLLTGSLGSVANNFGEFSAIFLEPLARGAATLLNSFLELPDGAKQVVIATTALTGALAAAIAVTSTLIALKAQERAALVIETALQLKNNAARAAGTVATLAQAAATGQLTAAQVKLIATTAQAVARAGVLAALVGTTVLIFERFENGGKDAAEAARELSRE
ncbi:MAG: phage tail tape measure protein, partial [Cyanobacteria bacterium P01_E01_bin.6]